MKRGHFYNCVFGNVVLLNDYAFLNTKHKYWNSVAKSQSVCLVLNTVIRNDFVIWDYANMYFCKGKEIVIHIINK